MNNFIITVEYFPFVMGKNKRFKVNTRLSKKEVEDLLMKKEVKDNEYYEVYVIVETMEEYLADIKTVDIDKIILLINRRQNGCR